MTTKKDFTFPDSQDPINYPGYSPPINFANPNYEIYSANPSPDPPIWFANPNSLISQSPSDMDNDYPFASSHYIHLDPYLTWKQDQERSNVHEPIAEQKKEINELKLAIYELQLNDERKDIKIKQLEKKKRKSKITTRKSKPSDIIQLQTKISRLEKIISTYQPDWRFTKDAHLEEAHDTTKE